MRFSVWPRPDRPWREIVDVVTHCDQQGWYGAYVADHFMPNTADDTPADGPMGECLATLAALAARTDRIRLAPLVCGNTYRHPAVLANTAATIDQISGGRFALGLGAGWQVNEHRAYGIEFPPTKVLLDRFEEACAVVTGLLREGRTTFEGTYYQLHDAPCDPKPVDGTLPLLVGAKGELRTMRIAARFADEWNAWCDADLFRHKTAVLDRHCDEVGRDPATIGRSTQALLYLSTDQGWLARHRDAAAVRPCLIGTPAEVVDQLAPYADAGCDEIIIPDWTMGSVERAKDTLDLFAAEVAAHFA